MKAIWGAVVVLGMASACGAGGDGPEFSADHPRIYMKSRKDSLAAALKAGEPEAMRFKSMVDRWGGAGRDRPEISDDQPRIYMKSRKDSLAAALKAGQPEAMRFKSMV